MALPQSVPTETMVVVIEVGGQPAIGKTQALARIVKAIKDELGVMPDNKKMFVGAHEIRWRIDDEDFWAKVDDDIDPDDMAWTIEVFHRGT